MNSDLELCTSPEYQKGLYGKLKRIQNRISSSPSSYLFYSFIIPVVMTYLLYLSLAIHPFGDGSVLVLDLNGQYVYFFESLRNAVYGDGSFLYTFFRALGGEYMGMYAYYLASPLSYIVALFPQDRILEALLTIILIKAGLCGFTFGFYLHKHSERPNKIMVVTFSVMYALCAFAVVHQNNIMWTDAIFWLPIVTYSIEQLITNRKYKLFVVSLALTMMSNYYIGYMVCIWCVIYFFYYLWAHPSNVTNPHGERAHRMRAFARFTFFAVLAALISAFILLSAYYSLTFGKNDFSNPNWSLRAKFDILDFFTKLLPGSYDTVRPEGLPFVYCGLLALICAPVYFMTKKISSREKLASLAVLGILVLCFIASPLDLIWHGFQNPNWLNHRYSFMFCFVLLVLAYKGFGNLRRQSEKFLLGICAFLVLFVAVAQKQELKSYVVSEEKLAIFATVWLSIIATIIIFALLCVLIRTEDYKKRDGVVAVLAAVICIEVFLSSLGCVVQFDEDVTYSKYNYYNTFLGELRPVVNEVKENDPSFYRMEKTVHRKFNDNMALGIRGLSNSTSTLNTSTIKFLENLGYISRSHLSQYKGGNPVNDSLLGVKYIIDDRDSDKLIHYNDLYINGDKYDVYKNPYALSIAYGVSEDINEFDFSEYTTYFEKLNALVGTLQGKGMPSKLFIPIDRYEEVYDQCTKTETSSKVVYTPTSENSKATVSYTFVAAQSAEYYFFTPSNNPKSCTIAVDGTNLGKYLGNDNKCIYSLGWHEQGEEVNVVITLGEEPLNIIPNCDYIWYLDKDNFEEAFTALANNPQFVISEGYKEDNLSGTITTTEPSTTVMTTISYDKGWKVYLDGEQIEAYETLDALVAFDIVGEGEHTLTLKYMPNIYVLGMTLSIFGLAVFFILCVVDFVLKKTLLKSKLREPINNFWVLEDFDEDYEQFTALPYEAPVKKDKVSLKARLCSLLKKKNNNKKDGEE